MQGEIVNKPYKSRWICGFYALTTIFIALLYLVVYLLAINEAYSFKMVFSLIMILVFLLIMGITIGFFTTRYRIRDGTLYSWSPFVVINLKLKNIKKVEKILVPLYIRFGASLYSGLFYVPSLGWVRCIITNLRDAILITTKDSKYYMITPSNPKKFIKLLKSVKHF